MTGALSGVRVIDVSDRASGAWCTRLLAALGADVLLVEPPAGHALRALAPFDDAGRSIPAAYFLADKRSIVLGDDETGRDTVRRLIERADILVTSSRPSELARRGLMYAQIGRPELIQLHVTAHGMTGPLAEVPGNDLTIAARSGWASINGQAGRPPLKPSGWQASYCTGIAAAGATVAALRHRDAHPGAGQEVDVSELEVMTATFAPALLKAQYEGVADGRRVDADLSAGPVPVKDGHFALTLSRAHFWRDAMNLLELPDLADDPRWESSRYRREHRAEYTERVQERMTHWTKMDLFDELAVRRVVAGPVLTMAELYENAHLRERGFWVRPSEAGDGPEYPGPPMRMSATPLTLIHAAPHEGATTSGAPALWREEAR